MRLYSPFSGRTGSTAIWAVCQYCGVDTASIHELDGYLTPEKWQAKTQPIGA